MLRRVFQRGRVAPAMNITPLIDVVFLLIVFFMLVSRIASQQREPMIVPELEDPQVRDVQREDRLVINVSPGPFDRSTREGPAQGEGQPAFVKVGLQRFEMHELAKVTQAVREARQGGDESAVLLRADAELYYEAVQPVMEAITEAGVERVHVVAYRDRQP